MGERFYGGDWQLDSSDGPPHPITLMETRVMPVQLICPNLRCRKFLSVPDDVRGKLVKCQHCQTAFRVPEPSKKPVDSAAAAK